MNNEFKDYYKILGVTPRATFENIRSAAERELSQNWNNAIGRLEIQDAYEVLADPERRKEYDLEFSKRLNEREVAIRNARTFEEYIAAKSLHPELANVDVVPEVAIAPLEETQITKETVAQEISPFEKEEKDSTTADLETNEILNNSVGDNNDSPSNSEETQESESEQEEVEEEQEKDFEQEEQEKELEQEEQEKELEQEEQEKDVNPEPVLEPTQENKEDKFKLSNKELDDLEKIRFNRKQNAKKAAIILGTMVFLGPAAGLIAAIIVKKSGKFKLQKVEKKGILKEVKDAESKLIQIYNENLEKEISNLLNKTSKSNIDNYELEISKLRYHKNLELLNARINTKSSTLDELGMKAHNGLHLFALKGVLNASILKLELMKKVAEKRVDVLENYTPKRNNDKLSELNERIEKLTKDLDDNTLSKGKRDRKTLKIRKLNRQRLNTIDQMKLNKDGISRSQLFWATVNSITNRKNENVVVEQVELEEQEQVKTH